MTIETKFNVGDEAIFICDAKLMIGHVDTIKVMINKSKTNINYHVCGAPIPEDRLFRNKEELFSSIEKQLANANSQKTL